MSIAEKSVTFECGDAQLDGFDAAAQEAKQTLKRFYKMRNALLPACGGKRIRHE